MKRKSKETETLCHAICYDHGIRHGWRLGSVGAHFERTVVFFQPWININCDKINFINYIKVKAIPLRNWSDPEGSRKLRFPDLMTTAQDGGKVASLTHRLPLPPGNATGTHFCWRLNRPQVHSAIGRVMSMKNSNDTIWNRTSDRPICNAIL